MKDLNNKMPKVSNNFSPLLTRLQRQQTDKESNFKRLSAAKEEGNNNNKGGKMSNEGFGKSVLDKKTNGKNEKEIATKLSNNTKKPTERRRKRLRRNQAIEKKTTTKLQV